ncbi:hypothetical protein D3C73_952580 [compost metagenome]
MKRIDSVQYSHTIRKLVSLGDVCAKPPYFKFFTKPFTKVELKNQNEFMELQKLFRNAGWTTLDLS